jgi:hypothetical protein
MNRKDEVPTFMKATYVVSFIFLLLDLFVFRSG